MWEKRVVLCRPGNLFRGWRKSWRESGKRRKEENARGEGERDWLPLCLLSSSSSPAKKRRRLEACRHKVKAKEFLEPLCVCVFREGEEEHKGDDDWLGFLLWQKDRLSFRGEVCVCVPPLLFVRSAKGRVCTAERRGKRSMFCDFWHPTHTHPPLLLLASLLRWAE